MCCLSMEEWTGWWKGAPGGRRIGVSLETVQGRDRTSRSHPEDGAECVCSATGACPSGPVKPGEAMKRHQNARWAHLECGP
jgi:hypothetical protein